VPRRFRIWEKKRGDRRTGSQLLGSAGEAVFFGALFLFGSIALTALLTPRPLTADSDAWTVWIWLVGIVLASLIFFGAGGFVYTLLLAGTTAERRSALAKRATNIDLLADALPSPRLYPTVPRDVNLTNSPGIKLAYRLPITRSPSWKLFSVGTFTLLWNAMVSVLVVLAIRNHLADRPDWYLTLLVVPFVVIGVLSMYYWLRLLLLATAIGPTSLEISDHPIYPGQRYRVYLAQAGRLRVRSLKLMLVCDEEATYRQGTDTRTERRRVRQQVVFSAPDFEIHPEIPYEHECDLEFPADVMHSFQSDHNAVQWRLVVHGLVDKWSDYERVFPIVVYPAMKEPLISIQIQGNRPGFQPGEVLECDYQIDAVSVDDLLAVEASVLWFTEGKGGGDLGVHFFERRLPSDAEGDLRQWRRFQTTLPNSPLSYDGALIRIRWCVRVRAMLRHGKQSCGERVFRLGAVESPLRTSV
jgi:hypothetical protein